MNAVDMKTKTQELEACAEVMNAAMDVVEGFEGHVAANDELAENLKSQTRENLAGCIFNDVMARISPETRRAAGKIDSICADAADTFVYKTWYGAWELSKIIEEFYEAMKGKLLEFPVEPYQEIYRISDGGDYVDNAVFEAYWETKPERDMIAWMLCDNGQLTFDDVTGMSYDDAKAFFEGEFEPEVAFFTTADEEGCC